MSNRDFVKLEITDKVAYVTLNKPEKYNALCLQLMQELISTGEELKSNKKIRAVILSGSGKGFCSGLDIKGVMKTAGASKKLMFKDDPEDQNIVQRVALVWRELAVPVIAAIHGVCYGGGFQIALGADFRFAKPDSRFSIMETKWGLIPDMGASITLPELVSIDVAKELTFTGRVFEAPEAKDLGVITRVVDDPMQAAIEFSSLIKERSPDAVMYGKKLFNETWLADDGVRLTKESEYQLKIMGSMNQLFAAGSNLLKTQLPYKKRKDN
jgi:enoyl-CoA hydratase/carnithine racemase